MEAHSSDLTGFSSEDLKMLANAELPASVRDRLSELLERYQKQEFTPEDQTELDHLLRQVQQLAMLRKQARESLNPTDAP